MRRRNRGALAAAGLGALAAILVLAAGCSDAPSASREANRSVLSELFSTTD